MVLDFCQNAGGQRMGLTQVGSIVVALVQRVNDVGGQDARSPSAPRQPSKGPPINN